MNRLKQFAAIFIIGLTICSKQLNAQVQKIPFVGGIRIAWDHSTLKLLSNPDINYSGYARMIRLHDGTLLCVYESAGNIECIRSNGDINKWSKPVIVATRDNGINRNVPDVLEKADHSLIVSYNLRPRGNNTDSTKKFSIRIKHSKDGGLTWDNEQEICKAGHEFINGCWEPMQIQLSSGEIQLFVSDEGKYTQSNEQDITVYRSFDGGYTWSSGEIVSFRKGFRDGMPSALVLKNSNEIIFSIEDNGIMPPEFKPSIIRTSLDNSWKNAPVTANDPNRSLSFDAYNRTPNEKYAGAPYLRQLPSGEIIMSYQGNEYRTNKIKWDLSDLIVCIGDSTGRNFNRKSIPFYNTNPDKTCLWNSTAIESDTTVIALASTNNYSNNVGVWIIRGYVMKDIRAPKMSLITDGEENETLYKQTPHVFIGGYGQANARIRNSWDNKMLYVSVVVNDTTSRGADQGDGVQIYLDPANGSTNIPSAGMYAFHFSSRGNMKAFQGDNGNWNPGNITGTKYQVKEFKGGYRIEIAVPWKALGGKPSGNQRIGFHAVLNEVAGTDGIFYDEPINGNETGKPFTWSSMYLGN